MAKSIEYNIFPELSPRVEIFAKAGLIEKSWLDQTTLSIPDQLFSLIRNFAFFRIHGTKSVFDEKDNNLHALGFNLNLLAALHNQLVPLLFIIRCQKGRIDIFIGSKHDGMPSISALLESAVGADLYSAIDDNREFQVSEYNRYAAITGIPTEQNSRERLNNSHNGLGKNIDNLVSGLTRQNWIYIVQAFPVQRQQTNVWLESCAREIKDIKEAFLHREIQKANRMATYYIESLEKSVKRLSVAKQQGLWQTGVYFASGEQETVTRGAALLSSIYSGDRSAPEPIRSHICDQTSQQSAFINGYNSKELSSFFTLPCREHPGFRLKEQILFDVDFNSPPGKSVELGFLMEESQATDQKCSIPVDDLTMHALIAGVTGSGKTNSIFNILLDLYTSSDIPFLVIEPAKAEYRALINEINSLLVFTLGEERPGMSAPFRLNPFAFPDGISLQTHIDFLKAVFHASFVMYAPMPYVLEECLYKIYEDKGWNLVTSDNVRGRSASSFPTLSDLYNKIDEVVANLGYQDRTSMDIKAALKTRIKNLCMGGKGLMLNSSSSISFAEIMRRPTVLELKYLGNDEEKSFMMGLILMSLWEYYESTESSMVNGNSGLKHLTVIEEAHRLLKNVPTEKTSEEMSNVKGMGVETFCNLLAEIRAYGEGVMVSEQLPVKLAPDVIKNSNLKLMHRMVAQEDRELMGGTMNLNKQQQRRVISLETGRAVLFREGLDRPLMIQVPLNRGKEDNGRTDNSAVCRHMTDIFYRNNQDIILKFPACISCPVYKKDCERTKKNVEEIRSSPDWEETCMQFILPYLLDTPQNEAMSDLGSVFHCKGDASYCLSAHLIHDYVRAKGDFHNWLFNDVEQLIRNAHEKIPHDEFANALGSKCREKKSRGRYALCEKYCQNRCLVGYEGNILCRDPRLHNRLLDLLDSSESGTRFYLELVTLIGDYLQDFLPDDTQKAMSSLGLCFLIQKLNEQRFSLLLQNRIVEEFNQIAEKQGN